MKSQVLCKICDIKDLRTAQQCAQLGADFIGLHGIWRVKPENQITFKKIVQGLSKEYPHTGIVLVTRQQDISSVIEMTEIVRPSYIQLHAPWPVGPISNLRDNLQERGYGNVRLIGVVAVGKEPLERVNSIKSVIDLLLLDSSLTGGSGHTVDPNLFRRAIDLAGPTPVLIAGGLNPENVSYYIKTLHPFGVDVQTGVEHPDKPGVKDPQRIAAFLKAVKSLGSK